MEESDKYSTRDFSKIQGYHVEWGRLWLANAAQMRVQSGGVKEAGEFKTVFELQMTVPRGICCGVDGRGQGQEGL